MLNIKDSFLKNNLMVFFASSLANALNFAYQVFMAHGLSAADYGVLNSLLSIFMIISLPVASGATMVAKFTSGYIALGERRKAGVFITKVFQHMFLVSVVFILFYFIYGLRVKDFLNMQSSAPVYAMGGVLFLTNLSAVGLGGLQGLENFRWYNLSNIAGTFLKLALAVLFIGLGWGVTGAIGAIFIAQAVSIVITLAPLRPGLIFKVKPAPFDLRLRDKYAYIVPVAAAYAAFAVFTNMDIILVKHFFGAAEAGAYSIAQLVGKITLFLPIAVSTVLLPRASSLHAQKKGHRIVLKKGLFFTAVLCGLVILAYNTFPELVLKAFTGKVDAQIILLGRLFSVAMTFFSLVYVLVSYQLSVNRFRFIGWLAVFAVLHVLAIAVFHRTLFWVLGIMIASSAALFLINLRFAFAREGGTG